MINFKKDKTAIWEALSIPQEECDFISQYFTDKSEHVDKTIESFQEKAISIKKMSNKNTDIAELEAQMDELKRHPLGKIAEEHSIDMLPDLEAECLLRGITLKENHYLHIGWCMRAHDEYTSSSFKEMEMKLMLGMALGL
jgi:hypothetical protein